MMLGVWRLMDSGEVTFSRTTLLGPYFHDLASTKSLFQNMSIDR